MSLHQLIPFYNHIGIITGLTILNLFKLGRGNSISMSKHSPLAATKLSRSFYTCDFSSSNYSEFIIPQRANTIPSIL
jgi:hypothetical protein